MSYLKPQIGKDRRYVCMRDEHVRRLKRWTNRAERHAAKRDPENAPKRRAYTGYEG